MTKHWLGDESFRKGKIFPDEIFPDNVYLTFMKVFNIFNPPAKRPSTSFSAVTSTNVGIRLQHFLAFSFNIFPTPV